MYKTRITRWGLDKKNKKCDMEAIVRKHSDRQRIGKRSNFRVRGKAVDYEDVVRYFHRRGESIDDVVARRGASKTPEAVACFTPILSPIRTPEALAVPELMFVTVRNYHQGCFEAGVWTADREGDPCRSTKGPLQPANQMKRLRELCSVATDLFGMSRPQEAGMALVAATTDIKDIVLGEDPHTLRRLFEVIMALHRRGRPEIALVILQQFSAMGETLLSRNHPLRIICGWLASTSDIVQTNYENIVIQSFRTLCEVFEGVLGPGHRTSIDSRLTFIYMTSSMDSSSLATSLTKLWHRCEGTLGTHDLRTLEVRLALGWNYLHRSNIIEAKRIAWSMITQCDSNHFRPHVLELLATSQYELGETQEAEINLRAAIDEARSWWGHDNGHVQSWLFTLEGWLEARGDLESAAQLQRERIAPWEPTILAG